MQLEPNVSTFLELIAQSPVADIHKGRPADARGLLRSLMGAPPRREVRLVEDRVEFLNGTDLRLRVYSDTEAPKACIVYLHGGGWVLGSVEESDPFARELAHASGCLVVSVEYRLAPEHPFPTGLDDCQAAVDWAAAKFAAPSGLALPLVLLGDSAGGNLATVVATRARDAGGPPIALQVLAYPVTDCRFDTGSYHDYANGPLLTTEWMEWFFHHYAGEPRHRSDPRISPLRQADLGNLPAALVLTAEHDLLRDEGEAYAARLQAAGVPTRLIRYPQQIHGFLTMVGLSSATATALNDIARAIDDFLPVSD